jgi:cytidylate kinase
MAVITISRQVGSGGDQIARRLCELLGYRYFDKTLMAQVAREQGISDTEAVDFSEDSYRVRGFIDALLRRTKRVATATTVGTTTRGERTSLVQDVDEEMAVSFVRAAIRALRVQGQVVVVGRGGQAVLRDAADALHVRIIARLEDRLHEVTQAEGLTREAASALIEERDQATAEYLRRFHGVEWADPSLYHLTVNCSLLSREAALDLLAAAARRIDARLTGVQATAAA